MTELTLSREDIEFLNNELSTFNASSSSSGYVASNDPFPVEEDEALPPEDESTTVEEAVIEDKFARFKDAEWFGKYPNIIIGGSGGIGSHLAFHLARTGNPNLFLYDTDQFSLVNLAGQFTTRNYIGKNKARATTELVRTFTDINLHHVNEKYNDKSMECEIVCAAFDNMKARRDMFTVWKRYLLKSPETVQDQFLLVDGRLLAEGFHIYCVTKNNMDWYDREKLLDDAAIPDAPCTLKQTTHVAASIAGFMTGFITNHISNMSFGQYIRELPSSFKMDIPSCTVQIDNEIHKK